MAAGFAELWPVSMSKQGLGTGARSLGTYLSTIGMMGDRTSASSFRRWGRLPVFWSCSITPTTISSSMPWVSTFDDPELPPGDGGGLPLDLSFWVAVHRSAMSMVVVVMGAPTRVSRSVSVSVSLRHVGCRLSKAVSARIAVLQVVVCRATAVTATSGGCCKASCRGDAVAMAHKL
jgi:hypothetical protein